MLRIFCYLNKINTFLNLFYYLNFSLFHFNYIFYFQVNFIIKIQIIKVQNFHYHFNHYLKNLQFNLLIDLKNCLIIIQIYIIMNWHKHNKI